MSRHNKDEIHILNRIMYLLEEQSVTNLANDDEAFCKFIEDLYAKLDNRALHLSSY